MSKLAEYWKALIAAVTPVFLVVQTALEDDGVSQEEWVAIGVAVVVALGVLVKANKQPEG
jgi:hypothetical protein